MKQETEDSLKVIARVILSTVNAHIKARSDGLTEDYLFSYLRTAYEEGERDGQRKILIQSWEFLCQGMSPSANENEAEMNRHASIGWEYLACDGRWIIWRRRKAVSDG